MDKGTTREFLSGLDEQELTAVEIAALLGDAFRLDFLMELNATKASKILNLLRKMAKHNIILEKPGIAEGVYSFAKKQFPDTVITFIADEKKELLLSRIIGYLEKEHPANTDKFLILSEMYLKLASIGNNAFQHMKKGADLLMLAHKTQDAFMLYEEIITRVSAAENSDSLDTMVFIDSVLSYAPVAINIRPPGEIMPIILKAKSAAEALENKKALAMLELCLGRLYQSQGNSVQASDHYNEGRNLAHSAGDKYLLRKASKLSALTLFWRGRMTDAIQMYENTLGDVEEISPGLQELWAYLMLAYCYGITGRIARGLGLAEAIKERAISKKKPKAEAFADSVIALILLEIRQLEKAKAHIDNALAIGKNEGSDQALWMAKPCEAYMKYSMGDLYAAQEIMKSAMNHARALGQIHYPSPWIIEILWALNKTKREPISGYSFDSEIERLMNWPDIYMKGVALRYHALALRSSGNHFDHVVEILEESWRFLEEAGARIELGRTQTVLAKILVEKGNRPKAKDIATMAYLTLSEIDHSLFPSELLSLIPDKRRENRMFHGLHAISKLGGEIDFEPGYKTYLGKILTLLTDTFGAERSALLLIQNGRINHQLNIAATRNLGTDEIAQLINSPVRDLMATTIDKKEPLVISDTETHTTLRGKATIRFPIKSLVCIPLLVTGKVIGLLYADNRLLEGAFAEKDALIMTTVATQVSLYLKSTTLHGEIESIRGLSNNSSPYQDKNISSEPPDAIIGESKAIKNVLDRAIKVASTDATVLLLGETGVGKELIARAIHQNSTRANKPFVTVNVSSLNENLLTSELFGHEKGAFTGADRCKIGRFEMADQGTLFLDEIGDLSIDSQVKLLRVLQEREFERVGGVQLIHSNFRLIAATNKNLIQMVAKGEFRSDLFYRINIYPIEIPPLRERKEDIRELVSYFMSRFSRKHHKEMKEVPQDELKKLVAYSWPGNIRELEHIIERALILSENDCISIPDLIAPQSFVHEIEGQNVTELLPLDEIEKRHIISVLDHVKWRVRGEQGAAKILGLKPSTLEFRMKKLGIKR